MSLRRRGRLSLLRSIWPYGGFLMNFSRAVVPWLAALAAGAALLSAAQAPISPSGPGKAVNFTTDVQPVLALNCTGCHGSTTRIKEMNLSTLDGVLKGSESGPVVVPGKPDESRLYQMVRDGKMPMGKP